jgi:hypothetical protein
VFDPSLTIANGCLADAAAVYKHFYEDFDSDGQFNVGKSSVEGSFTGSGYETNNEGQLVPVLYAPTGNGDDDTFFYVGIDELGGVIYDKWRKIEYFDEYYDLNTTYYTWDGDAKCYVYTDRIVVTSGEITELSPLKFPEKIAEVYQNGMNVAQKQLPTETWVMTLEDGSTVTKEVIVSD